MLVDRRDFRQYTRATRERGIRRMTSDGHPPRPTTRPPKNPSLFVVALLVLLPRVAAAWETVVDGVSDVSGRYADAFRVAVTPGDDVVAVGASHFIVIKLAGATGAEVWRYDLGFGITRDVAVDAPGTSSPRARTRSRRSRSSSCPGRRARRSGITTSREAAHRPSTPSVPSRSIRSVTSSRAVRS
jgi:hypothetical protein